MSIDYPNIAAPTASIYGELQTPLEFLRLARAWGGLPKGRSPNPRTVVLVPGFGASDFSMTALARHLRNRRHRVRGWGLGRNDGQVRRLLEGFGRNAERLAERAGEPLVAVGWSLGGFLAREAARDRPELFRQVITMGSPVIGGPRVTATADYYQARGFDLSAIEQKIAERYEVPLRVPVTAIYSRRDGVVAWEACIDCWSPEVRHVEVDCTHLGMGFCADVIRIVDEEIEGGAGAATERGTARVIDHAGLQQASTGRG